MRAVLNLAGISRRASERSAFVVLRSFVVLALLTGTRTARAQQVDAGAPICTCTAEHAAIDALQEARRTCEAQRTTAETARASCAARLDRVSSDLSDVHNDLDAANASIAACQTAHQQLCAATGEIVTDVLQSRPELPDVPACVTAQNRHAVGELVTSWRNARLMLQRLDAYSRGDVDAMSVAGLATRSEIDVTAQRLAGSAHDAPLVYRRLLVEALRRVAPDFWASLRRAGRDTVDEWFASSADLDAAFVAEVQSTLAARPGDVTAGPSQASALRFVRAYRELVGCSDAGAGPRQCARATQLQAFLESNTALVVRQRIREIWHEDCEHIAAPKVLLWLREFPTPQPALGRAEWHEVERAGFDKLVTCYLGAAAPDAGFVDWLTQHVPSSADVAPRTYTHLEALRSSWDPNSDLASCLDAARALRSMPVPATCSLPPDARASLRPWFLRRNAARRSDASIALHACGDYVDALWHGRTVRVAMTVQAIASAGELVRPGPVGEFPATAALRSLCDHRVGSLTEFPRALRAVTELAALAGEDVSVSPWNAEPGAHRPIEAAAFDRTKPFLAWARSLFAGVDACAALDLGPSRCRACTPAVANVRYQCALVLRVESRWREWQRLTLFGLLAFVALTLTGRWAFSFRRAFRRAGAWRRTVAGHLRSLGIRVQRDPLRWIFPSRTGTVNVTLPGGPWERWGRSMAVVSSERANAVGERDVQHAALAARAVEGEIAIVTHDESASPDLPAVRAILDWAARGPRGAVHVLPVSTTRLQWAASADDLLDLIEQVSLRGNPFEMRGRLVSSSQFFNRERLVSGLLAATQAGSWTVVTGLRRFGKSSLALEVARKLQAPHAYVDLAGFHHEITSADEPSRAVDTILGYMLRQLHASAASMYGSSESFPALPDDHAVIDTGLLTRWIRAFLAACRRHRSGRPVSPLVIFDEIEQAIGIGPERINNAINVLSILIGRLRAAFTDALVSQGADRVGVLFCSAIHAALWAPLTTLGRQSLLGAFPSVFVPRLPDDAAHAMMRGLGARQGIRFTDPALALIVREAQGIPILVRRIGSSVLELYDPERARQGGLGAVEIGIEGATAAVRREEDDGAPLRVWVESEIGDPRSPVGSLLRTLARRGTVPVAELKQLAFERTHAQLVDLGLGAVLGAEETRRRAQEAAGFVIRMLDEIGILTSEGDAAQPSALTFPDSVVRRVLVSSGPDDVTSF